MGEPKLSKSRSESTFQHSLIGARNQHNEFDNIDAAWCNCSTLRRLLDFMMALCIRLACVVECSSSAQPQLYLVDKDVKVEMIS